MGDYKPWKNYDHFKGDPNTSEGKRERDIRIRKHELSYSETKSKLEKELHGLQTDNYPMGKEHRKLHQRDIDDTKEKLEILESRESQLRKIRTDARIR